MPIDSTDIQWKYSIKAGSGGNRLTQTDPNRSLGGYISTTQWLGMGVNDLFDDLFVQDAVDPQPEYRCVFVLNRHPTLTLHSPRVWFSAKETGGAGCAIGIDPTAATPADTTDAQAVVIEHDREAPHSIIFSSPGNFEEGLELGDLPPGHCRAVWIKREAHREMTAPLDSFKIRVQGWTSI